MKTKALRVLAYACALALVVVTARDMLAIRALQKQLHDAPVVTLDDGKGGHKLGSSTPWGGDLAGSLNAAQYVASISGNAGAGTGTIPFIGSGAVTRGSIDFTHGVVIAGKGGSDAYSAMGPLTGFETSDTALWLLQNGTARTATNYALEANSTSLYINTVSGAGAINFMLGNGTTGALNGNALFLGGAASAAAPIFLQYTTPTAPVIESGSGATSFTIGTTNASGQLIFQGLNATTLLSLGGATGQGLTMTAAAPTIAATGNTTLTAAQAADPIVKLGTVSLTGNVTVTFPNAAGFWIVDASGITLNAHTLQFISGSTTAAAIAPSTTSQLFFVSTYGTNTISVK